MNVDINTGVSHVINSGYLISAALEEPKDNDSDWSDDKIVEEKISWPNRADAYTTSLKFAERQSRYSEHKILQFHMLHSAFIQNWPTLKKKIIFNSHKISLLLLLTTKNVFMQSK